MPAIWIIGILSVELLTLRLTDQRWVSIGVTLGGMLAAAWAFVKRIAAIRAALDQSLAARDKAEQDRAAMEQALRQAQTMEGLGRLAVGVAHDFNNHLTVISSNIEMLARRLDPSQARLLRHTDAAMQGVQRAAALTGRLLSFCRQPAPEPEAVDVNRLLSGLSDLLRRTLGDRIGLEIIPPDTSWLTWADLNQLENVLLSLTVNAGDQVRAGETLTIEVANIRIDATADSAYPQTEPGEYIRIAVGDCVGLDQGNTWVAAGTADFSMAGGFAREAGGTLLRNGKAGGGIALRLLLPRYAPATKATAAPRRKRSGHPVVLVVEDDPDVRSACVEILRDLKYRVLEAPDAMEAFRLIADQGGIDLLFTDLGLPGGVTGHALADAARNVDADIRVLFTTGYPQVDLPDRPGAAVLRKPFSRLQFAAMVREVFADDCQAVATGGAAQPPAARSATVTG